MIAILDIDQRFSVDGESKSVQCHFIELQPPLLPDDMTVLQTYFTSLLTSRPRPTQPPTPPPTPPPAPALALVPIPTRTQPMPTYNSTSASTSTPATITNGHPTATTATAAAPTANGPAVSVPSDIDATITRLSSHRNVRGVMILSRDGPIIRHTGAVFDGEQGKKYAGVVKKIVDCCTTGLEEAADETGVSWAVSLVGFSTRVLIYIGVG